MKTHIYKDSHFLTTYTLEKTHKHDIINNDGQILMSILYILCHTPKR